MTLMSKLETPMTRWHWQQVGGTLTEEFCAVSGSRSCGTRLLDGVLIKGGELRIARQTEVKLKGQDIVVIQTKAGRLGMYVMGQAFFSAQLMQRFAPRSVESVALVGQDDEVLRPLFEQYPGMRVVVCPADVMRRQST
jgi:hypothetical protein